MTIRVYIGLDVGLKVTKRIIVMLLFYTAASGKGKRSRIHHHS